MKALVAGGAGYIGSHMCKLLAERGHEVVVFDDLSSGYREAVQWGPLVEGSLLDPEALDRVLAQHRPDAVLHFAARIAVGESVTVPYAYYANNVAGTLNLLTAMQARGVSRFIFSSTAAIFGEPQTPLLAETHPQQPLSPYGRSKLMIEWMLADAARAYGLRSVALRYFNAAGADPEGRIGEAHEPETHLIPRLLAAATGSAADVAIYGDDYPTADGTCVRDYIHVDDLAAAHLDALALLDREPGFHAFNLGNGTGFSVRQVVAAVSEVVGRPLRLPVAPRRAGDSAVLVASSELARQRLGWTPRRHDLRTIIEDAWRWHRQPAFGPSR